MVFLLLVTAFLNACSWMGKDGQVEVIVSSSDGKPLTKVQVDLTALEAPVEKKEGLTQEPFQIIGHLEKNNQEPFLFFVDFSKYQKLKLSVNSKSIEELYLPELSYFEKPKWWQEQKKQIQITLSKVPETKFKEKIPKPGHEENDDQDESILNEKVASQEGQWVVVPQMETTLTEKPYHKTTDLFYPKMNLGENNSFTTDKSRIKSEQNDVFQEKKTAAPHLSHEQMKIKVLFHNKSLEHAHVWIGKSTLSTIHYLGESDEQGKVSFAPFPSLLKPDTLIVKKQGYLTVVKPLQTSTNGDQEVELQDGKNILVDVQNYAYGVGRGVEKVEWKIKDVKKEVSGPLGIILLPFAQSEIKNDNLFVDNSFSPSLSAETIKERLPDFEDKLITFYVQSKIPWKPAVGFVEPPMGGTLFLDASWRRARREFFGRFMNDLSIRGVVPEVISKILDVENMSPSEMAHKGWQNKWFSPLLDMLVEIHCVKNDSASTLMGLSLFSKEGLLIYEEMLPLKTGEEEKTAAVLYSHMANHLPFEGTASFSKKGTYEINLGSKQNIQVGDEWIAYVSSGKYGVPEIPMGSLRILSVSENNSVARLVFDKLGLRNKEPLRVVRYPHDYVESEIRKKAEFTPESLTPDLN